MGPRIPPPFADPPQPTRNASKLHADFGECPPGPGRWLRSPPRLRLGERVRRAGGGLRWLAQTAAGRRSQPAVLPPPLRLQGSSATSPSCGYGRTAPNPPPGGPPRVIISVLRSGATP